MPETLFLHIPTQNGSAARVLPLQGTVVRVGRSAGCDVRVDAPGLADVHCRFRHRGSVWTVEPVSGLARVLVDGVVIDQATPVSAGSAVQLGPVRLGLHAVVRQERPAPGSFETPLAIEPHAAEALAEAEAAISQVAAAPVVEGEAASGATNATAVEAERLARWQASLEFRERWLESRREELWWEQRWRAASERLRSRGTPPSPVGRAVPPEPGRSRPGPALGPERVDLTRPVSLDRPGPSLAPRPATPARPTLPPDPLARRRPPEPPPIPPVDRSLAAWAEEPLLPLLDPEEQAARIAWENPSPDAGPVIVPVDRELADVAPPAADLEIARERESEPDALDLAPAPTAWLPAAPERPLIESDFAFDPVVLLPGFDPKRVDGSTADTLAAPVLEPDAVAVAAPAPSTTVGRSSDRMLVALPSPKEVEAPTLPPIAMPAQGSRLTEPVTAARAERSEDRTAFTPVAMAPTVEVLERTTTRADQGQGSVPEPGIAREPAPQTPEPVVTTPAESLPLAPLDRTAGDAGWPSAREILEAHRAQQARAADGERSPEPHRRRRPVPTASQPPETWSVPAALALPPALALAVLVGGLGLALAGLWVQDESAAATASDRLLAGQVLPAQGLDVPGLPRPSWWASTADHLYQHAVVIGPADDPARAEEARFLLGLAASAAPLHPGVRYTAARWRPDSATDATDLNLSRDIVTQALAARHRLAAGDRERALIHYRDALEMACRSHPSDAAGPKKDPGSRDGRLLLPNEDLIGPIVRELAAHPGWTYDDWSAALPDHGVALLAGYRALRDRNDRAADRVLDRLISAAPESIASSPWPAVERAARAEARAERRQWREAETLYRAALASTSDTRLRHAWWLNLAEIAGRLNDLDARREALDRAWNETEDQAETADAEAASVEPAP